MYRKIQCRIWHDRKFLKWTALQKMTFFYLLTGRHSHPIPGVVIATKGEIAQALIGTNAIGDATHDDILSAIEGLIRDDVLTASTVAPLMYLPNALKHNSPTSPGQVKMWGKTCDDVPECELKSEILSDIYYTLEGMSDGMSSAMRDGMSDGTLNTQRTKNKVITKAKTKKRTTKPKQDKRKKDMQKATIAQGVAEIVIAHLSVRTKKKFSVTKTDIKRFKILIDEKYSTKQMISVIDWAVDNWSEKYRDNITAKSLFNVEKFRDYTQNAQNTTRTSAPVLAELKPIGES